MASCHSLQARPLVNDTGSRATTHRLNHARPCLTVVPRRCVKVAAINEVLQLAALDIDWTDTDVQIGVLGAVLGLGLGIGAPVFYSMRDERDEERLEELRALNRATYKETGEYLTEEEIKDIRPPRWTDRREFVDDD